MTGATGSIGRPLIDVLVRRGVDRIYALTHVEPFATEDPRVRPITGDICAGAGIGLSDAAADEVCSTVNGIIHAAAETRFAAPAEEAAHVNTDGTRNVLAFARRCRRLDRVVALSTTHVAGRRIGDVFEDELEHGEGFVNAYEASKYEAERALRVAVGDLPISVCRLSSAVGHSRSGAIAHRGAIHQAVLLMYAGLAPLIPGREDAPVDLVAVDYAVEAIATLATDAHAPGRTWHVCAGDETIAAGELLDLTLKCFEMYRPAWRRRAIARPAVVDLETFDLFRRTVDQAGDEALRASVSAVARFAPQLAFPKRFDCSRATAALAAFSVSRPSIRDTWTAVVRWLIQPATHDQIFSAAS